VGVLDDVVGDLRLEVAVPEGGLVHVKEVAPLELGVGELHELECERLDADRVDPVAAVDELHDLVERVTHGPVVLH
jgi:hypothetical protein